MVTVGIAGLGSDWETRYRPALRKLRERIAVCALYDPVASRAAQIAANWNAAAVDGLVALSERADVRALLLLDAGWHGFEAVRLLCRTGKPLLIAAGLAGDQAAFRSLHEEARLRGQTIMPAFSLRYTPASSRLRELLATRLGPPRTITIDARSPDGGSSGLLGLVDWCRYVVGAPPVRVDADAVARECVIRIEFAGVNNAADAVRAELRLNGIERPADLTARPTAALRSPQVQASIVCTDGTATLESAAQIVWQNGGGPIRETLSSDRDETEVTLDLFCRRVVGGLIPAPDLSDVLSGMRLLEAAEQSLETRRPVAVAD